MNTSVGAIIQKENQVVIVRGNKNPNNIGYSFPKGHMENQENDLETIFREVYEECGIKSHQYQIHNKIGEIKFEDKIDRKIILYYATINKENLEDVNVNKLEPKDKNIIEANWVNIDDLFNGKYPLKSRMDELFQAQFKK